MKKKNLLVLGALACGLLITSCGDSAEDSTTGYKLTVEKDSGVDSVTFTSEGAEVTNLTSLEEGTELTAKITLKDDYEISAVTLNGSAVNVSGGSYVFDMPATDSTFKVTTKEVVKTPEVKTFALTVEKDAGIKTVSVTKDGVALTDLSKVEEGSALVATVTPEDGFTVSAVTLDGVALTLKDGAYAFNMPSKAATLKVTSTEIPPEVSTISVTNDDTKGSYTLTKGTEAVSDGKVNVGDTVKLTVTPNFGYLVSSVTLDGTQLELADDSYVFTVTKSTHTVVISYEEKEKVNVSLTVYQEPETNFYEDVKLMSGGIDVTDGGEVYVGSEVKVVLTVDGEVNSFETDEYTNVPRLIYLHVGDKVYHGDDDNAEVSEDFKTLTFTVDAPDTDTLFSLSYNRSRAEDDDETAVNVTLTPNENLEFYGYSATDKYVYNAFNVGIKRTPGYVISKAVLNYEDGTTEELTYYYYLPQFSNDYASWTYGNRLKGDVTITFEGEVKDIHTINYVNGDSVTSQNGFETSKIAGETVNVYNIKSTDSSKTISGIKFTGVDCTAQNYGDTWNYSFTMPDNDVTIEFVLEDLVPLAYTPNDNIESVVFRSSSTTYNDSNIIRYAKAGSTVFAFATAKKGFLLGDATANDGKKYELKNSYGSNYYYEVTVPEDGLTLTIAADVAYDVIADSETADKVRTNISNTQAIEGATVNFSYSAMNALYVIKDVYLENARGEKLDIEISKEVNSSSTSCSFVMPAEDVTICYEVAEAQKFKTSINVSGPEGENLDDIINSFTVSNLNSKVDIRAYEDGLTAEFVENTATNISLSLKTGYEASATYTYTVDGEDRIGQIGIAYVGNGNISFEELFVPANIKSIDITISKATPLVAKITHDESLTDEEFETIEFAFTVNGSTVEDLSSIYKGDNLGVTIETEAEKGYVYQFELTDDEGNPISETYYGYQISSNFTITVSKAQAYSYTVVYDESLYFSTRLTTSDNQSLSQNGLIYVKESGLTGHINITYASTTVDYVVTVNGVEVDKGTIEAYGTGQTKEFDINGNIVITFTAHAE